MKALLIQKGNGLKRIFKELTNQMNSMQPENIQQKKMKLIFKNELFYDIEPSEKEPSWVDVTFVFKEDNYGEKDVPVTIPKNFFVYYKDLNDYSLSAFTVSDLNKILSYAESEEDYELCSIIRNSINNKVEK